MRPRPLGDGVSLLGAIDWDRRLFDALIPLPDGTSYNAYLVQGRQKTALLDSVDPSMKHELLAQLQDIPSLDYLVAHHAEQDHSGAIPDVLAKYPEAKLVCTGKAKGMLEDHLHIPPERFTTVDDQEQIDLGGKTLRFIHTPWVHWPETMCTYLPENRLLFSCDFFGSHLAGSDLFAQESEVYEPAKRYFAEIMMPFRNVIRKNLDKIKALDPAMIAPSHGPIHGRPAFIIEAYADWISDDVKNEAAILTVSMHGSTAAMASRLLAELASRGVTVKQFNLAAADIGKLAIALVDCATVVAATPTVHVGPHPLMATALVLANALRAKARFAAVIGSYGWATKVPEIIPQMIPNLKVELLSPVICRGYPKPQDLTALERLAEEIALRHESAGILRRG